ncbi:MAG: LPS assembly protein LptD [Desulfuromonadales bacterium]|nr:LPS assembly protein LptD [Desulfuromonadales bacterium]
MRRSLQIFLVLLCFGSTFGLPSAFAEEGITIGFVPGQGIVRGAADAQSFAELLSVRLGMPVQVRLLDSEDDLLQWLQRYREIDCGWLSEARVRSLPAAVVLTLAGADSVAGAPLSGRFVARQGSDAVLLQQLRVALLVFGGRPDEAALLSSLNIARFVEVKGPAAEEPASVPPQEAVVAASQVELPTAPPAPSPLTATPLEPPISLVADRLEYDSENKVIQASGSVIMQQGETILAADELIWQENTRDAAAKGQVRLTEPSTEFEGDSLQANFASGQGLAREGRIFVRERNFHLAGDEIERLGEATYHVTGGRFTTCDGEVPDWRFTADQVDVTLGRYATARNVWFEVRNQPLIYLPYLLFPVKSERESGFLLPRAGYSSRKGALLSLAWYEVIDRHLDATVYLDYLSRVGVGKGLEYRYILDGGNAGEALFYHVTGLQDEDDAEEEFREAKHDTFALKWNHNGYLPGGVRLAADVDYVEDLEFFEDFGDTAEEYNRDHTVSTIMLQRSWQELNLTVVTEYIRNLVGNNDATLQRLPEVNLAMPLRRLGNSPFFLQAENLLTNFVRDEGVDGQRLYFHPELSVPMKPGNWLELTPKVALHGRYYNVDSPDDGLSRDDYDDESLVAEYAVTASTRFARVFPFAVGGLEKLQHSIEPQVTYTYIPEGSQEKLPYFGVYDRIGPANRVEYALVNRLTGRAVDAAGNRSYRELLNLRLSQYYDVARARDESLRDPEDFSNLRVELQASPTPASSLTLDALVPVYGDQEFSRVTASAGYTGRHGDAASLNYTYVSDEDGTTPSDYLELNLTTALLAPVYAQFQQRYDFYEKQSLESLLNLEYRSKCWSLFLTLRNRPSVDDRPDNNEIMVGFALSGLGRVGGYGSKLGPSGN